MAAGPSKERYGDAALGNGNDAKVEDDVLPEYEDKHSESLSYESESMYTTMPGQVVIDEDDMHSSAMLIDDGRVNLEIDTRQRKLSRVFAGLAETGGLDLIDESPSFTVHSSTTVTLPTPNLNIVIQLVGSRGDVQPFVALGHTLQQFGHRVRIATHGVFRNFVKSAGLEFFNIGGDPQELMAYMVRNPGLMPNFGKLAKGELLEKRRTMRDILHGCWRSCFASSGEDEPPFVANVIIANPPSFAGLHCAEKLGIPLHIVFTMPWSPTRAFCHPLAKITKSTDDTQLTNLLSFALVEILIWQGLGPVINGFRRKVLKLEPIDATRAPGIVYRSKIPHTYCWSPSLIPKPTDWPSHISITGYCFLDNPNYTPSEELQQFLRNGPAPVYIGFGSIVVPDPTALTSLIFEAVRLSRVRALISSGWADIGGQVPPDLQSSVLLIKDVPHEWLFQHVSAVVHHGGSGTTAAGIRAGKPTIIVPFFGDQPFWGDMVARAKLGPSPIHFSILTASKLSEAIKDATSSRYEANVEQMSRSLQKENGVLSMLDSVHATLPTNAMRCSVCPARPAMWRHKKYKDVRLSGMAAIALTNAGLLKTNDLEMHHSVKYNVKLGPWEPVTGGMFAVTDLFYETFRGIGEVFYDVGRGLTVGATAHTRKQQSYSETGYRDPEVTLFPQNANGAPPTPTSPTPTSSSSKNEANGMPPSYTMTPTTTPTTTQSNTKPLPPLPPSRSSSYSSSQPYTASSSKPFGYFTAKGTGRILKSSLRAPMAFTYGMTQGAHEMPKLWGDKLVRPQPDITGIRSGVVAGVKELTLGTFDGLAGLVVQPIVGAKEEGVVGFVKGVGKGTAGLPVKWFAAAAGSFGYPLKGVDVGVKKMWDRMVGSGDEVGRERVRLAMWEYETAGQEVRDDVVRGWEMVMEEIEASRKQAWFGKRKGKGKASVGNEDVIAEENGEDVG